MFRFFPFFVIEFTFLVLASIEISISLGICHFYWKPFAIEWERTLNLFGQHIITNQYETKKCIKQKEIFVHDKPKLYHLSKTKPSILI